MLDQPTSESFRLPPTLDPLPEEIRAFAPKRDRNIPTAPLRRPLAERDSGYDESGPANAPAMVEEPGPADASEAESDYVNHPRHYNAHPSGIECITITRWMNFNLGNVFKYLWRADEKGATIEDLRKAQWYLADEIARLEKLRDGTR